jgi:IS5 family transposase
VCKFRHLLERHRLGEQIFKGVAEHLQTQGFRLSTGTIVDATLIAAPSSTKNVEGKRDPEMPLAPIAARHQRQLAALARHQSKKGNQWYFGMKAHVGVDARHKLIHSVVATAGNVADSTVLPKLLHGQENAVWGDTAYSGQARVIEQCAPWAVDLTQYRGRGYRYLNAVQREINRKRSKVRSRVEHTIGVIKRVFGFTKVRYRGLAKNGNRLFVAAALANLYTVRRQLMQPSMG